MRKNIPLSSPLYSNPSFLKGSARLVDLFATLTFFRHCSNELKRDRLMLDRDWQLVGFDMALALKNIQRSHGTEKIKKTK